MNKVGLMMALEVKLLKFILKVIFMSVPNFMAIHVIIVQIFQSGTKWCTDSPTKQHSL